MENLAITFIVFAAIVCAVVIWLVLTIQRIQDHRDDLIRNVKYPDLDEKLRDAARRQ